MSEQLWGVGGAELHGRHEQWGSERDVDALVEAVKTMPRNVKPSCEQIAEAVGRHPRPLLRAEMDMEFPGANRAYIRDRLLEMTQDGSLLPLTGYEWEKLGLPTWYRWRGRSTYYATPQQHRKWKQQAETRKAQREADWERAEGHREILRGLTGAADEYGRGSAAVTALLEMNERPQSRDEICEVLPVGNRQSVFLLIRRMSGEGKIIWRPGSEWARIVPPWPLWKRTTGYCATQRQVKAWEEEFAERGAAGPAAYGVAASFVEMGGFGAIYRVNAKKISEVLHESGRPLSVREIMQEVPRANETEVRALLEKMGADGQVVDRTGAQWARVMTRWYRWQAGLLYYATALQVEFWGQGRRPGNAMAVDRVCELIAWAEDTEGPSDQLAGMRRALAAVLALPKGDCDEAARHVQRWRKTQGRGGHSRGSW